MTGTSDPICTVYIYRRNHRIVAVGIGIAPPDIARKYDSLTRIPIVRNGKRPAWRTFTHHIGREPWGNALARRRWPETETSAPPATPPPNRGKRPPARKREPQVGDTIVWNGEKYKILAINSNDQVFARHTRTKEAINIALEEVTQ